DILAQERDERQEWCDFSRFRRHIRSRFFQKPRTDHVSISRILIAIVALTTPAVVSAQQCTPIAGAQSLLRRGAAVMLGEIHGTEQAPRFLGDLACAAVTERRLPVTIALELPLDVNDDLSAYLTTPDS